MSFGDSRDSSRRKATRRNDYDTDALNTLEFEDYYVILPSAPPRWDINKFIRESNGIPGKKIHENFCYNSGTNSQFLTVEELRQLIYAEETN